MKNWNHLGYAGLILATTIVACKQAEAPETTASEVDAKAVSSSAAVQKDDGRKIIRTADIKFKTKNVAKSTYAIENAVSKFGGFVTFTDLNSQIIEKSKVKIAQDSILEITKYTVLNDMTIRVPNTKLDTVIKIIAKEIDFLDSRQIKADDVSLQILANQLAQVRKNAHATRLENAIDTKGKKVTEISNAEEDLETKKQENDEKKLDNLSLKDKVDFSTLSLQLYQNESIKKDIKPSEKMFRQGFGLQIVDGLQFGWYLIEDIITFIIQFWSLIVLSLLGFILYKKYSK
ncbi:hypothetical protein B0A58_12080 [Flavobacterium branchiophilum NBRC 15030 = ATCC 35035]|uniref:Uncharacterized protein DUF4349 n=1 Tax=Flavobacterium branchiophilum TaxID=55197 RepID=A0A543G7L5_9FLAO|nr:DUF4349 domain-containing protein [Flavobacterium branchiophilum]OXA73144.1 hypothetical protein B0A58_12080 [Flavobacterium branchiophilum NBRC 15030 = ATCC 35035]TQM41944.1 uncharacterized protein DUF4349 [Flavobacterium branchiophilum]GEM55041.1 hypothetical protein FB1_12620 [Flavobacterium branchiophilum NBRC 15030 = ATCC 35035]